MNNIKLEEMKFKWEDLHKKVGQIIYVKAGESDIAEGNLKDQVYFVDSDRKLYLIHEE